jgi:chromosome segregation ATPase
MQIAEDMRQHLTAKVDDMKLDGASRKELSRFVAVQLSLKGYKPSVAMVRDITQQGSMTDISRDLAEIREEIGKALNRRTLKTAIPESFQGLAEELLDRLWQGAMDHAIGEFDAERRELAREREEIQAALRNEQALRAEVIRRVEQLQEEVAGERAARNAAEQDVAALQARCEELESTVLVWKETTEAERRQRAEEAARFSRELQATREEYARALEQAEGNRRYVLIQLDATRDAERTARDRIKDIEADRTTVERRYRTEVDELRNKTTEQSLQIGELRGELRAREAQIDESQLKIKELEAKLAVEQTNALGAARRQVLESTMLAARYAPEVRQLCELENCATKGESDPTTGQPLIWLEDKSGRRLNDPASSAEELVNFCKSNLVIISQTAKEAEQKKASHEKEANLPRRNASSPRRTK